MIFRKNDGFTLVELMVTILVSTLVAAAAATTILFGLRINKQSSQTQRQQSTTRILITALEDMVSEGAVGEIYRDDGVWEIRQRKENADDPDVALCYFKDNAICARDGTVLMDDIRVSDVEMNDDETLLTVHIQTEEDLIFSTSIRCRMKTDFDDATNPETLKDEAKDELEESDKDLLKATTENRTDFLNLLSAHYENKGWYIPNEGTAYTGKVYYSEWYIKTVEGQDTGSWMKDWNPDTPWCACFISWALNQQKNTLYIPQVTFKNESGTEETLTWINEDSKEPYWFADVDKFMAYFQLLHDENLMEKKAPQHWVSMRNDPNARPNPGDIIFFDTDLRDTDETTNHVGVVFHVDKKLDASGIDLDPNDDVIYTIEGNSLGKVAIRQYSATNKTILGYGVLPWIPNLNKLLVGTWESDEGDVLTIKEDGNGVYTENNKTPVDYVWEYTPDTDSYTVTAQLGGAVNTVAIAVRENILTIEWDSKIFTRPLDANTEP